MKIHKYTIFIVLSLLIRTKGVNITEIFVKEGETFIFHLPHVESDSRSIRSAEWKQTQTDRNKVLAIINLENANKTLILQHGIQFMQNGSMVIGNVTQEDSGNYTCKVVFRDNKIQTHIISLKLISEITEQIPTNSTSPASVPQDFYILQIVLPALVGLILLVGVVIFFTCKMKHRSSTQEPIYINSNYTQRTTSRTHNRQTITQQPYKLSSSQLRTPAVQDLT